MKQYTYLLIDIGCILVPFIFSFYRKNQFSKEWKFFLPANIFIALIFIIWDVIFTNMGIWGFNPDYLIGVNIANLPIEEILFFICIPYACVFTYFAISHLLKINLTLTFHRKVSLLAIVILLGFGILHLHKLYTSVTFLTTAILLIILTVSKRNLSYIYLSYILIIPFFLISNGLLTGSYLESPIVWYDGIHNTKIRVFTIPIEDFIYGFLLISTNILVYEFLKNKFQKSSTNSLNL
jgi:lycopene cyclase domain-containing protein